MQYTCKNGHQWSLSADAHNETLDELPRCPTCGLEANTSPEAVTLDAASPKPTTFAVPTIPGYQLEREIGRGGMGVIYLANQIGLNRPVAIKMILSGAHAGGTERERFKTESSAIAQLQHANIVQVYEVGEVDNHPFSVLEYVHGGSLADRLDGTPLSPEFAAQLVEPLARAMSYTHKRGIVHRDLKPANILLQPRDSAPTDSHDAAERFGSEPLSTFTPKLTDFGLAKLLSSSDGPTQSGAILGTPSYMAPEQAGGQSGSIGPAADIYSLGAILYELLTGRPPFRAATPLDTILQVVSEEPVPPSRLQPYLPRDLETICLKCLQKEPRKRYESADELADDLIRFQSGRPILARPVGWIESSRRWAQRNPRTVRLILALAISLSIGMVAIVWSWQVARLEREAARRSRDTAVREADRAHANLQQAVDAVDRMLTRVVDEKLAYVPQFEVERTQILEDAVTFYQRFLQQESDNPTLLREAGRANAKLGQLFLSLGRHQQAEAALRRAIDLNERSRAEFAHDPNHQHGLADSLRLLAVVMRMRNATNEADMLLNNALEISDRLRRDHPNEEKFNSFRVKLLSQSGLAKFQERRIPDAERYFVRAVEESTLLVSENPNQFSYRLALGDARQHLTMFYLNMGQITKASALAVSAVADLESLATEFPDRRRDIEPILATCRLHLGEYYFFTRQFEPAVKSLRAGIDHFEKLVRDYPLASEYQFRLGSGYRTLGRAAMATGRLDDAVMPLSRSVELYQVLVSRHPELFFYPLLYRQALSDLVTVNVRIEKKPQAASLLQQLFSNLEKSIRAPADISSLAHEISTYCMRHLDVLRDSPASTDARRILDRMIQQVTKSNEVLPSLLTARAFLLTLTGDHFAAGNDARRAATHASTDAITRYNLACVFALSVNAARNDPKLPQAEKDVLADRYAVEAIEYLRKLKAEGYFKVPARATALAKDTDLESLRSRDDFRRLRDEVLSPVKTK